MCVFKYHAFIFSIRPPRWQSETSLTELPSNDEITPFDGIAKFKGIQAHRNQAEAFRYVSIRYLNSALLQTFQNENQINFKF
jgi:hypothetical protein